MTPRVYVSAVLGTRTGGPEAVHQLVHALLERGVETRIVPARGSLPQGPHKDYSIYNYSLASRIPKIANEPERDRNHRLVITEVSPLESWKELRHTPSENTWLWWLSVNNAPDPRARYFHPASGQTINRSLAVEAIFRAKTQRGFLQKSRTGVTETISLTYNKKLLNKNISHLAQSYYAVDFCRRQFGKPAKLVSDYLRPLPDITPAETIRNLVTYNGSRGYSLVGELERAMPDVDFVPIAGMNYQQVCEALDRSAAYIELGHLPGRDRLPREAGRLGTPVVLLQRGAGAYAEDFPLPDRFRIPHTPDWAREFEPQLRFALNEPAATQELQGNFHEWVLTDKARFDMEIDEWLPQLLK